MLVILEDLNTKSMISSAGNLVINLIAMYEAETGLNHSIRSTGWGGLASHLSELGVVHRANPVHTSLTCSHVVEELHTVHNRVFVSVLGTQSEY